MPSRPDQFPRIAAKKAATLELTQLFEVMAQRAEIYAQMHEKFTQDIGKNREVREGKPVRFSKNQKRLMEEYQGDAEKAVQDMEHHMASMDDVALLTMAVLGIKNQLQLDEDMFPGWHRMDKPAAKDLIVFTQQTLKLVEEFIESSPLRDKVADMRKFLGG